MRSRARGLMSAAAGGTVALMAAAAGAFASTPTARSAVLPPLVVTATPAVKHQAEPHPEIRAAIHSLERAKDHLEHAAHDFGGHRVDAIAAIDVALKQLRLALDYDK